MTPTAPKETINGKDGLTVTSSPPSNASVVAGMFQCASMESFDTQKIDNRTPIKSEIEVAIDKTYQQANEFVSYLYSMRSTLGIPLLEEEGRDDGEDGGETPQDYTVAAANFMAPFIGSPTQQDTVAPTVPAAGTSAASSGVNTAAASVAKQAHTQTQERDQPPAASTLEEFAPIQSDISKETYKLEVTLIEDTPTGARATEISTLSASTEGTPAAVAIAKTDGTDPPGQSVDTAESALNKLDSSPSPALLRNVKSDVSVVSAKSQKSVKSTKSAKSFMSGKSRKSTTPFKSILSKSSKATSAKKATISKPEAAAPGSPKPDALKKAGSFVSFASSASKNSTKPPPVPVASAEEKSIQSAAVSTQEPAQCDASTVSVKSNHSVKSTKSAKSAASAKADCASTVSVKSNHSVKSTKSAKSAASAKADNASTVSVKSKHSVKSTKSAKSTASAKVDSAGASNSVALSNATADDGANDAGVTSTDTKSVAFKKDTEIQDGGDTASVSSKASKSSFLSKMSALSKRSKASSASRKSKASVASQKSKATAASARSKASVASRVPSKVEEAAPPSAPITAPGNLEADQPSPPVADMPTANAAEEAVQEQAVEEKATAADKSEKATAESNTELPEDVPRNIVDALDSIDVGSVASMAKSMMSAITGSIVTSPSANTDAEEAAAPEAEAEDADTKSVASKKTSGSVGTASKAAASMKSFNTDKTPGQIITQWDAAKAGDFDALQMLNTERWTDWTATDQHDNTALFYACKIGATKNLACVALLLELTPKKTPALMNKCHEGTSNECVHALLSEYMGASGDVSTPVAGRDGMLFDSDTGMEVEQINEEIDVDIGGEVTATQKSAGAEETKSEEPIDAATASSEVKEDEKQKSNTKRKSRGGFLGMFGGKKSTIDNDPDTPKRNIVPGRPPLQPPRSRRGDRQSEAQDASHREEPMASSEHKHAGDFNAAIDGQDEHFISPRNNEVHQRGHAAPSEGDRFDFPESLANGERFEGSRPSDHQGGMGYYGESQSLPSSRRMNRYGSPTRAQQQRHLNSKQNMHDTPGFPVNSGAHFAFTSSFNDEPIHQQQHQHQSSGLAARNDRNFRSQNYQPAGAPSAMSPVSKSKHISSGNSVGSKSTSPMSLLQRGQKHGKVTNSPMVLFREENRKWIIANQKPMGGNRGIFGSKSKKNKGHSSADQGEKMVVTVHVFDPTQKVHIVNCHDVCVQIHGCMMKSLLVEKCTKINVVFDSITKDCKVLKCKKLALQGTGTCPAYQLDKTDVLTLWLSEDGMQMSDIVTNKCTKITISVPDGEDSEERHEFPLPEHVVHKISGGNNVSSNAHHMTFQSDSVSTTRSTNP